MSENNDDRTRNYMSGFAVGASFAKRVLLKHHRKHSGRTCYRCRVVRELGDVIDAAVGAITGARPR